MAAMAFSHGSAVRPPVTLRCCPRSLVIVLRRIRRSRTVSCGLLAGILWTLTTATPVRAQAPTAPGAPAAPADTQPAETQFNLVDYVLTTPRLAGDWLGFGDDMRAHGIDVQYYWQSHFLSNLDRGRNTGALKHSATYDLFLRLDLDRMGLIPNGEALVQGRQQWGEGVNPWTGATQQVDDDSDGNRSLYVDQLWYRHFFLDRKVSLQVGYLDYQTIVDRNEYANSEDKQFMAEVLDNNPLIPTASATGLGAALTVTPCKWYSIILGGADAQRLPLYKTGLSTAFHDEAWFLFYLEQNLSPEIQTPRGPIKGNYRFGMVYDPLPRSVFVAPGERPDFEGNDVGFYASFDQMLFRENPKDSQGLGVFARYAFRHRDVYRFNQFWSVGAVYTGLLPGRDKDTLGFAFGQLVDSDLYRNNRVASSGDESYYELYYAIQLLPWLVLTPDIQYVDNPGGNDSISHAIAGGLRLRVTF